MLNGDEATIEIVESIPLIKFLLFSLKRTTRRCSTKIKIGTLPTDRGINATADMPQDIPAIKVSLFRQNDEDPSKAYTKIKIAGSEINLPVTRWTGDKVEDTRTEDERDKKFAGIQAKMVELLKANPELKGEIEAPLPKGAAVPHGDVIRILDAFLDAGVTEVNFGGVRRRRCRRPRAAAESVVASHPTGPGRPPACSPRGAPLLAAESGAPRSRSRTCLEAPRKERPSGRAVGRGAGAPCAGAGRS